MTCQYSDTDDATQSSVDVSDDVLSSVQETDDETPPQDDGTYSDWITYISPYNGITITYPPTYFLLDKTEDVDVTYNKSIYIAPRGISVNDFAGTYTGPIEINVRFIS